MQIRRLDDVKQFAERVEPFLMQREAEHCLLLGNLWNLINTNIYPDPPYLAYIEQNDAVVAVAVRTLPHKLVISEMAESVDASQLAEIAVLVADDVYDFDHTLPGVVAPKAIGAAFVECWEMVSQQPWRIGIEQRIFKLENVIPVIGVSGEMRAPTEADRELLIQWMIDFSEEAVHEIVSREDAERMVHNRLTSDPKVRAFRMWWDEDKPVAFAGYGGLTPHGIRIGPVYTPPEARQRGYASALTAQMSQQLLDMGRTFCFLFTDISNPTSNHIYQTIGYEAVSDVDEYRFSEAQA